MLTVSPHVSTLTGDLFQPFRGSLDLLCFYALELICSA
jgi:hypothetical protein